jgi:hypothetical protein
MYAYFELLGFICFSRHAKCLSLLSKFQSAYLSQLFLSRFAVMEHAFVDLSELATFLATAKPKSYIGFGGGAVEGRGGAIEEEMVA